MIQACSFTEIPKIFNLNDSENPQGKIPSSDDNNFPYNNSIILCRGNITFVSASIFYSWMKGDV